MESFRIETKRSGVGREREREKARRVTWPAFRGIDSSQCAK